MPYVQVTRKANAKQRKAAIKRHDLLVEKLRVLDREADEARVPFTWRA